MPGRSRLLCICQGSSRSVFERHVRGSELSEDLPRPCKAENRQCTVTKGNLMADWNGQVKLPVAMAHACTALQPNNTCTSLKPGMTLHWYFSCIITGPNMGSLQCCSQTDARRCSYRGQPWCPLLLFTWANHACFLVCTCMHAQRRTCAYLV